MRNLEDVVKSLTESIVFEFYKHGPESSVPAVRAACTAALRESLPYELHVQRSEAWEEGRKS